MKFIFIFLFLGGLNSNLRTLEPIKDSPPKISYELEDHHIIKRMADPIEITNHAENLLYKNSYLKQNQLVLPKEDLEYIRSNQIPVNLTFRFQFEWWNPMQHHVLPEPVPRIVQSLKAIDIIGRPRQIVSRLIWPSNQIRPTRPFAHAIMFYYDDEFNLWLAHQLETDLQDWEIKAVASEPKGAPQNYRLRLENLVISYPVPSLFEDLPAKPIEVPTPYSRQNWKEWWEEFNQTFLNSWIFNGTDFDRYLLRPRRDEIEKDGWDIPGTKNDKQFSVAFKYQDYPYLKIYKYFFSNPRLKVVYHQYLDLALEFNNISLLVSKDQNYWEAFKLQHQEWIWWLEKFVKVNLDKSTLILRSSDENRARGEAKIKVIISKKSLASLPLKTNFDSLQLSSDQPLEQTIFEHFKVQNLSFFRNENFANYSISQGLALNGFVLKSLDQANFSGEIELNFKDIKRINKLKEAPSLPKSKRSSSLNWASWICLGIIISSSLVLIFLKFTKSKQPKKE